MSLRIRITLVISAFSAVIFVIAGASIHQLTESDVRQRLDQRLTTQVNVISDPLVFAKAMFLGRFYKEKKEAAGEKLEEILDVQIPTRILIDGRPLIATNGFPEFPDVPFQDGFSEIVVNGVNWRVKTETHNRRGRQSPPRFESMTFQAAITRNSLNTTLEDFRSRFFMILFFAVIGIGFGGWFLGGAALHPLSRLRKYIEEARDSGGLFQRLPEKFGPGEVDLLAKTLNEMLTRLELNSEKTEQALRSSRSFASNVSHELRTPLTSIQMNLELLDRHPDIDIRERSEILANITIEQRQLLNTLESLRLLARGDLSESQVFEEIDFLQFIQEIIERHKKQWGRTNIQLQFPSSPPLVWGWREGLTVLFRNVLENSQIHSGLPEDQLVIDVSIQVNEKEFIVRIDDNGIGIPASERNYVLGRFQRGTKGSASGSGLGLSLVKQQAELHGGSVSLSNSPENGARVTVILPSKS